SARCALWSGRSCCYVRAVTRSSVSVCVCRQRATCKIRDCAASLNRTRIELRRHTHNASFVPLCKPRASSRLNTTRAKEPIFNAHDSAALARECQIIAPIEKAVLRGMCHASFSTTTCHLSLPFACLTTGALIGDATALQSTVFHLLSKVVEKP